MSLLTPTLATWQFHSEVESGPVDLRPEVVRVWQSYHTGMHTGPDWTVTQTLGVKIGFRMQ